MNIKQISELALGLGIKAKKQNKAELIRLIQQTEGNFACFATAVDGECDQANCLWRQDCLNVSSTQH
tara:strand:+ start:235 stop:435 length:201 start_codon:yes stop_codon:yes gene_type:complete